MSTYTKLDGLLRFHRQHVFDAGDAGDRHERALRRIKRTKAFRDMCDRNRANAEYRASERLLSAYA